MLEEYFEAKKKLYTQSVKGKFRRIKSILNSLFLSIYIFFPFFRFERGEGVPNQAILIDIPNSRAYFFFIEIWPSEVYYLAAILISSAVTLFFITSLFGRVWCGYACFQTVWSDIFSAIEKFFQGDRNQRILLDRKRTFEKFYKKFLTHLSWILVSLFTGFIFTCYFNDSINLIKKFSDLQIPLPVLGWIAGIGGMTYVMAGFAREHVCTYMCPYSRFQSAMFDRNSLIITYDQKRGEPRGKIDRRGNDQENSAFQNRGHCIDCKQCVVVCPQGIDIRDGLQMECIACGLCIDACDNVMEKIGLPKGLIRYDTLNHLEDPSPKKKFKIAQARTFYYSFVLIVVFSLVLQSLIYRPKFEFDVIPDRNPLFVRLSDGSIRNGYLFKVSNKTHQKQNFSLKITNPKDAKLTIHSFESGQENELEIKQDSVGSFKIFVTLPKEIVENNREGRGLIDLEVVNSEEKKSEKIQAVFISK